MVFMLVCIMVLKSECSMLAGIRLARLRSLCSYFAYSKTHQWNTSFLKQFNTSFFTFVFTMINTRPERVKKSVVPLAVKEKLFLSFNCINTSVCRLRISKDLIRFIQKFFFICSHYQDFFTVHLITIFNTKLLVVVTFFRFVNNMH